MTVRELIAELSKLDLDKGIWVFYDGGYKVFPPIPDSRVNKREAERAAYLGDEGVREHDYIISAG